jgi:DNA-binding NarL/FixJ family response regulator
MSAHRIFVIWKYPLFYETVRLLLHDPGIEWVGATSELKEAKAEIAAHHPDTIVIEEEEGSDVSAELSQLLHDSSIHSRIFSLNLSDNDLEIYHRERRTVLQPDDLLNLIQDCG